MAAKLRLRLRSTGWLGKQQPDKVPSLLVTGSDPDQINNHQLLSLGECGVATQREPSAVGERVVLPPTTSPAAKLIFSLKGKAVGWKASGLRETWGGLGKCQSGVGKLSLPVSHFKCIISIVDALVSICVPLRGCCTTLSYRQGEKQRNCVCPVPPALSYFPPRSNSSEFPGLTPVKNWRNRRVFV